MIVFVRMLAFHAPDTIRMVNVPDSEIANPVDLGTVLGLAYEYGQNENCSDRRITSTTCSVSVGDVVELRDGNFLVMPVGFKNLTDEEYSHYKSIPNNRDRVLYAYTQ